MDFYKIVILITVILLILALTGVGFLLKYQNAGTPFPPPGSASACPDKWSEDVVGSDTRCVIPIQFADNAGIIHTDDPTYVNFLINTPGVYVTGTDQLITSGNLYAGGVNNIVSGMASISPAAMGSICQQKKWTTKYGVLWDGVSNNSTC